MMTALMMLISALMIFPWLVLIGGFLGTIATGIVYPIYHLWQQTDGQPEDAGGPALETKFRVPAEIHAPGYEPANPQGALPKAPAA